MIGYKDLDLKTASGNATLDKRIKNTAREACDQLKTLYPFALWDTGNQTCINDAVHSAMAQAKNIEASSSRNS